MCWLISDGSTTHNHNAFIISVKQLHTVFKKQLNLARQALLESHLDPPHKKKEKCQSKNAHWVLLMSD